MNILEKRKVKPEIYDIIKNLTFGNYKLKLAGSASLASQRYYSDYDFNCNIRTRKQKVIYSEFKKILSYENDKLYFIEFKIEYLDGTKLKLNDKNIKLSMFKNIKFVKIDYILFFDYVYKELSIIYNFYYIKEDKNTKIQRLKNDYNELFKEGNIYKSLKRLFSIYKIQKDYANLKNLTSLFNSNVGKLYEVNSNLKTIQLLKTMYNDAYTNKRIEINLKFLRIDPNEDLDKLIIENDKILNKNAKKYM